MPGHEYANANSSSKGIELGHRHWLTDVISSRIYVHTRLRYNGNQIIAKPGPNNDDKSQVMKRGS
ncbi:hypothetical protein EYZ11_012534 [Aspergillus tanneri]|uniref:Uncharacterized protein n=1 Tax=Aspergillus tanneri TaxID=1220188 RepID=A0A4S3J0A7_9EURO|nr:hypothetical protein EYZ11_012534 [Aspergillus tanneri]